MTSVGFLMILAPMEPDIPDIATLIACPQCDALHRYEPLGARATARCIRCGTVLFSPRPNAIAFVLALAISALVLMSLAVTYPFLTMSASGLSAKASVIDTVESYADAEMLPLSIALGALILFLPVCRLLLLIYVTGPLAFGGRAWPGARTAFRLNARLRPWSMVEIFMVGVAVAMVKIAGLAQLEFGLAFWAFGAVAILVAAKDALMCERTLWQAITRS